MFRDEYARMNGQLAPRPEVVRRVVNRAAMPSKNWKQRHCLAAVLAVLGLCLLGGVPVLAANVPLANDVLYQIAPAAAQLFRPVQRFCENNGIRMEVVSAYIHENVAEIYLTLQDLTGDRVDATTDLFDSYSIRRPFDSTGFCNRVGYDEATGVVTFLVTITEWGDHSIVGDKITFSLRNFISQKKTYDSVPVDLYLGSLPPVESREMGCLGGGGVGYDDYVGDSRTVTMLVPGVPIPFPVEGVDLTGVGYVDGLLHVQTAVENNLQKDNNGSFTLLAAGKPIEDAICNVSAREGNIDYVDYIFDIPESKLEAYSLQGSFVTSGAYTEGNWQVTIPLTKMAENGG